MKKTILVTGANGQLGSEIKYLSQFHNLSFLFTDIDELDINCIDDVRAFFSTILSAPMQKQDRGRTSS